MEPLLRGGDAALAFLILESIKKTVDAQDPENKEICEVCFDLYGGETFFVKSAYMSSTRTPLCYTCIRICFVHVYAYVLPFCVHVYLYDDDMEFKAHVNPKALVYSIRNVYVKGYL